MTQPSKPETPENTISEGQDKPRKTSVESPKASQPTCLRGGFIRLFLKKTERNNSPEDSSMSDQNAEDKNGVRSKKRRVLGGNIFRLPCLKSTERTDIVEQNNGQLDSTEQQGQQAAPEEDLKPYSKASFLKKIRGYRLMREREATEKLKVIEATQSNAGPIVEERQEKLGTKTAEPESRGDMLVEKGKDLVPNESKLGITSNDVQVQDRHSEISREKGNSHEEQESQKKNTQHLPETEHGEESHGEKDDGKKKNLADQKIQLDNGENLGQDSHENQADEEMVRRHVIEHESGVGKAEGLGHELTKQDEQKQGEVEATNNVTNQNGIKERVQELVNTSSQHIEDLQTKEVEVVANDILEQEQTLRVVEKLAKNLPEQNSPELTVTEVVRSVLKQDNETERATESSEQNNYTSKVGEVKAVMPDQESHSEVPVNLRSNSFAEHSHKNEGKAKESDRKFPDNKINTEKIGEPQYSLVEMGSHHENKPEDHFLEDPSPEDSVRKPKALCLEQNSHKQSLEHFRDQDKHSQKDDNAGDELLKHDNFIQNVEDKRDYLLGEESHHKDKLVEQEPNCLGQDRCSENGEEIRTKMPQKSHLQKKASKPRNQALEQCTNNERETKDNLPEQGGEKAGKCFLLEEINCVEELVELEKGFPAVEFDSRVKEEILITHIIRTTTSEESHKEFPKFQEEEFVNTGNVNFGHQEIKREDIKDGDNDKMECGNCDWTSLQVEVKDMVQWLVDEASDRLTDFNQDPQGTE